MLEGTFRNLFSADVLFGWGPTVGRVNADRDFSSPGKKNIEDCALDDSADGDLARPTRLVQKAGALPLGF